MAYNPFTWQDDATPITAARLNAIESGIAAGGATADSALGVANSSSDKADTAISRSTAAQNTAGTAASTATAAATAASSANTLATTANSKADALRTDVTALQQASNGVLLFAPAPSGDTSGATDQNALNPLLAQAANGKGTLYLMPGVYYVTGLSTPQNFDQPRIQGPGRDYCRIIGTGGSATPAVKFQGGSGRSGGGGISDVTIENPNGSALVMADCISTTHYRLVFQNCVVGAHFKITQSAGFCEFNVVYDSDFRNCIAQFSSTGVESFHGSGIDGNTTFNNGANSMIQIDPGCLPYQSPLNFTAFTRGSAPVIRNLNAGGDRAPLFYGNIRIECFANNAVVAGPNQVNFNGGVQLFGGTGANMGSLALIDSTYYNNAGVWLRRKPWSSYSGDQYGIGNSPGIVGGLQYGIGHLVDVDMRAPNYFYRYLLWVTQNPFNDSGNVVVLSTLAINNAAGYGAVTNWSIGNYALSASISNAPANASSPVRSFARFTPVGDRNLF